MNDITNAELKSLIMYLDKYVELVKFIEDEYNSLKNSLNPYRVQDEDGAVLAKMDLLEEIINFTKKGK